MKPVSLKVKGLNSFVEAQTIEFSKLTEKGLFGIFGPTGSGKSTILDGITIALYGKVSRDTKEFVNTDTNVVEISYDFEIGVGKTRKLYRAERSIKRLKTGNFKTSYARLIEINREKPEESKVLAEGPKEVEENIIEIIGLKVEDFTRSVVLPQGKFNEFLKLTGKDRRNMLERIFALEKYGTKLYDKIRGVRNANLKTLSELEGEMKGYENVGEEAHKNIKDTLAHLKEEEKEFKLQKNTLDKQYEEYKIIWELQKEKEQYTKKGTELKLQEEDIKNKKERFTKGTSALNVKPFMDNVDDTKKSLAINKTALEKLKVDFKVIGEKLKLTKASYEEAMKDKNNKLPILIEKEANLKQAITIEEKIIYLAKEKDILLVQHKELTRNISEKNLKHATLEANKIKIEKQLQLTEESLSKIQILPEYRERLQNTYNRELEVIAAEKNVETLKNKAEVLKKAIHLTVLRHGEVILLQESKQNKLVHFEEKSKALANNFPGDNNLLLEKQKAYSILADTLEKAVENEKIKAELQEKQLIIVEEAKKTRENLENAEEYIAEKKTQLKAIEGKIKDIEISNMAAILASNLQEGKLCPVCGSEHHPHLTEASIDEALEEMKTLKQSEEVGLEKLSKDYQKLQIKMAELLRDRDNVSGQLAIVIEKLILINIKDLEQEKILSEKELFKFKESLETYNKEKTALDQELIKLKDEKSKVDTEEAKLGEGLKKEKEALIVLEEELSMAAEKLKQLKEQHKLLLEDLNSEEEKQKGGIAVASIKEKIQQLKAIDNEVIKLTATAKKYRVELIALEKERTEVDKDLKELTNSKTEIETSGKEKRAEIQRLTNQIQELCGFEPSNELTPKIEIEKVRGEIKEITDKEAKLKDTLEKENVEKQTTVTQKTSEEKKKEMLLNMLTEGEEKLNRVLKENNFENVEIVSKYLISRDTLLLIEKEIKQYEEALRSILDNLQRIENLLEGKVIEAAVFEELKEKREAVQKLLEEKTKAIGAQNRALEEMERKLQEVKALVTKKSEVEHKLSLLRELDSLIQGNKFVEYVAMKQLKYISMEASKRLKDITRGRYALELDSDGAFIMRDDFNGGTRRETNTLSGGETFLTSLCLALALSSQIQLKGSAPLEFFFLDEGFGTLDTELLETVMNSLEKLHSSTLSVGIISHVEELKNRVPIKLIVSPAQQGQGGSKVKLEYT